MTCPRCQTPVTDDDEICWYCNWFMCSDCWEAYGHCGHPEADEHNRRGRLGHLPEPEETA